MKIRKKEKRRLYPVINRPIQYKFLGMVLAYGMITVILVAAFLFVPDVLTMNDEEASFEMRQGASQRILLLYPRFCITILGLIFVTGLHSWRAFHRVIGPLFRFKWAFEKISEGKLNFLVRLRKKDFLDPEAQKLNQMIDVLAEKWENVQTASLDSIKSLEELEQSIVKKNEDETEIRQYLQTHRKHLESLIGQVRYFQLSDEEKEE
ncbi:MAG: methyl-accepting chemotaxis protein [Candidatus Aminicenantes bacterium]|nr:MAG: methyl-accepting chemotaxis protein [Candidatus Aminicenantes bacterium]